MRTLTLKSFAKVNLFLKVLNKRPDNYHNIETIFERISLHDTLTLKIRSDNKIKITCNDPALPVGENNFCYKSAQLLRDKFKVKNGVEIKITKRIPVSSGLGGGSSNAAAALLGLNRLWRLGLPLSRLVTLSRKIGCDVPFFIYNCSFAKGLNRGDRIIPLYSLKGLMFWHVIVVPKIRVSTPYIYRKWDDFSELAPPFLGERNNNTSERAGLTIRRGDVRIFCSALIKNASSLPPGLLYNGLEDVTLRLYPQVRQVKKELDSLGLKTALMSGSGSAVFAIAGSKKEALIISRKIRKRMGSWRVFSAGTA